MEKKRGRPISKVKKTIISSYITETDLNKIARISRKTKQSISKVISDLIEKALSI